ncbi:hypothetical protein OQ620_19800, partial [Klebsiella pneumoniae]|nr:hypothetical protein [Klebsiella pneumoniae]
MRLRNKSCRLLGIGAVTKKWQGLASPEQWADYTYEMVGYGDKTVETAQNYGRFGGLSFLPEGANIWA